MKQILLLLAFLGYFSIANAQEQGSIITDRPDQTESSNTVGKNYFQWETGTVLEVTPNSNSWTMHTSLFRYGITKNFELRLNTDLIREHDKINDSNVVGLGDLQVGFKYQFLKSKVEMAWLSHAFVPAGSKEFKGLWATSNKILLSHDVTDWMSFGYNFGYEYFEGNTQNVTYTYAVGFSLTEKVSFFTELYGDWTDFDEWLVSYDNGFTYLVKDNLQIDLSLGLGINHDYNFYSAGISWRLPK
jgi:hypothetical protein